MTELVISDVTRMDHGFCVIGLEKAAKGFRSVRPVPPSFKWVWFPYERAEKVAFDLRPIAALGPHIEDRSAAPAHRRIGAVTESALVECLKQAEVSSSVTELFGCSARPSPLGGNTVCVNPGDAKRSICGCMVSSISFSFRYYPRNIRVALALGSGDRLDNLPLVDRDWYRFAGRLENQNRESLEAFFNSFVLSQVMSSPILFTRIGITRPDRYGVCWPMLDSLFPLPKNEWLKEYR